MNYKSIFIIAVAGLTVAGCKNNEEDNKTDVALRTPDKVQSTDSTHRNIPLDALLKPTNTYVISTVPVTTIQTRTENMEIPALGTVQYDFRQAGTIAARITGRIEKLFVRYRYQYIHKGQKVLKIYSPELLTSQNNLIYLLKNDPTNSPLISAAKERLVLLGMSAQQVSEIANTGKPIYSVSVYSNYSGFVTDAASPVMPQNNVPASAIGDNNTLPVATEELSLKEGMYVNEGQPIFTVINTNTALVALDIFPEQQSLVKIGDAVKITAETSPVSVSSTVAYIEPSYGVQTKTLQLRAYINNSSAKIPIGSQVKGTIFSGAKQAAWLPASAVLSLGLNDVVFKKEGELFRAHKVTTGIKQNDKIQILSGLTPTDSVAVNAQFLTENESFIQAKQ